MDNRTCRLDDCTDGKLRARGMCARHYDQWLQGGKPALLPLPPRTGICEDCGSDVEATGARGCIPKTCPPCKVGRQQGASNGWKGRNRATYNAARRAAPYTDADRERHRAWIAANRDRVRAWRRRAYIERQAATSAQYTADYRRRHPGKHVEEENRRRARKLGADSREVSQRDLHRLLVRFGGLCGYCQTRRHEHWDHVIPLSRGGRHAIGNLLPSCAKCNLTKRAMFLAEWRRVVRGLAALKTA